MSQKIGFIGVGSMGAALAGRLVDDHALLVHDLNPAAADQLVEGGAVFATPREIARACGVVFLSVPGPADVEKLVLGDDGLIEHLTPGSVVIDTTTSSPALDAILVQALAARGVEFADAGIAGGVRAVREGHGTLMVGRSTWCARTSGSPPSWPTTSAAPSRSARWSGDSSTPASSGSARRRIRCGSWNRGGRAPNRPFRWPRR
jgi:6-phosphogluconate dehydrogenase (decarboxylating)